MLDIIQKHLRKIDALNEAADRRKSKVNKLVEPIVAAWVESVWCDDHASFSDRGRSEVTVEPAYGKPDHLHCHWYHTFRGERDGSSATIPKRYFTEGGADIIKAESDAVAERQAAAKVAKQEATERAMLAQLREKYSHQPNP